MGFKNKNISKIKTLILYGFKNKKRVKHENLKNIFFLKKFDLKL